MSNDFPFEAVPLEPMPSNVTFEHMNAIITFRTIWLEMALWMRNFIYSFIADHPNIQAVANRLYTGVPLRFYNSLTVFYGHETAEEYLRRISNIIVAFWGLLEAMKNNDQEAITKATGELYAASEQGADFLAGINSYWDKSRWQNLFHQFISMGIQVIFSVMQGNYDNEIRVYDRIRDLAVIMGNYMANGIIARGLYPTPPL